MVFEKYDSALKMRAIIARIAKQVVDRERPVDKVARVVDMSRLEGFASVVYAGDEVNSARVHMYPGKQPQRSDRLYGEGAGSIVRISGPVGSRYIAEILSDSPHQNSPTHYSPAISTAGSMEDSLYAYFSLQTTAPPPADSTTNYYVAAMNFPSRAGMVDIYTEMLLSDGTSYIQSDSFIFDNSTTKYTERLAGNNRFSSTGMSLQYFYVVYDGADDDLPDTLGIQIYQRRGSASTKSPVSSNILLMTLGVNARVTVIADGDL